MLQEKLKEAKQLQKSKRLQLLLLVVTAILCFVSSITLMLFEKFWGDSSLAFLICGVAIALLLLTVFFYFCLIFPISNQCFALSCEIEDLNEKIALPKDWIYDVDIKVCCASDLILQKEIQNMRIRYLQDRKIELQFQYKKKKHTYFLDYYTAKELLKCKSFDS